MRMLALALMLLTAVTAVGLGQARGTLRIGGEVVLCQGGAVVTVAVPGEAPAHGVCPDMAPLLAAGLSWAAPQVAPVVRESRLMAHAPGQVGQGRDAPAAAARGPPAAA